MRSLFAALVLGLASVALSADATESLRAGTTLMPVKVYSLEDDRKMLKAFEGLRVADVSDPRAPREVASAEVWDSALALDVDRRHV